jgi:hypothetical protein
MGKLPRAGIGTMMTGIALSIGGSVGLLFSDAPSWAKWALPIIWGFYLLRSGHGAFLRDWDELRENARLSDSDGRRL